MYVRMVSHTESSIIASFSWNLISKVFIKSISSCNFFSSFSLDVADNSFVSDSMFALLFLL